MDGLRLISADAIRWLEVWMVPAESTAAVRRICCTFLLTEGIELEEFLAKVRRIEGVPEDEMEVLFAVYERVRAVYPRTSGRYGFFGLDNVLFDGERVWLADRESAFLDDQLAALALVANSLDSNDAEECAYLTAYCGAVPDAYQRARFFLIRQLTHVFYAMVFLYLGSLSGRVHLNQVIESAWSPRFGEALQLVGVGPEAGTSALLRTTSFL